MGRLTLNVLLSFAQFEREVIGERVRDKIAASKRKGIWVTGNSTSEQFFGHTRSFGSTDHAPAKHVSPAIRAHRAEEWTWKSCPRDQFAFPRELARRLWSAARESRNVTERSAGSTKTTTASPVGLKNALALRAVARGGRIDNDISRVHGCSKLVLVRARIHDIAGDRHRRRSGAGRAQGVMCAATTLALVWARLPNLALCRAG
jgi:hypothetical protein